jgi:hypothetical protein
MKIRKIIAKTAPQIDDKEFMWASIIDANLAEHLKSLLSRITSETNNFKKHPMDVFEFYEISEYRSELQNILNNISQTSFPEATNILKYLISYFSVTTYPE